MATLMVLYSRVTVRHSVSAGWHLHNKCFLGDVKKWFLVNLLPVIVLNWAKFGISSSEC